MKIKPLHLAIAGIALIAAICFLGKTTAPAKKDELVGGHVVPVAKPTFEAINLNELTQKAKANLSKLNLQKIDSLTAQLSSSNDKAAVLQKLINAWKAANSKIITALYAKQLAETTHQPIDYANAGAMLTDAFENCADSNLSKPLCEEAYNTLQQAIELDTNNIDNKVNLAAILMEGKNQVMGGVPILLSIVKKSPNHLKANFILAKFAVVSGQFDKAITRLEKIISLNPAYTDAYLVLANAYAQKGERVKAQSTLKQCQQHISDATAKAEINKLIEKFN